MDYGYGCMGGGAIIWTIIIIIVSVGAAIGLAFIPATIARNKGYSFGGFWVFGFFLWLPAIIVAACLTPKVPYGATQNTQTAQTTTSVYIAPPAAPQAPPPQAPYAATSSPAEEKLRQLQKLREQGFVTEEEYQAKRRQIIESM